MNSRTKALILALSMVSGCSSDGSSERAFGVLRDLATAPFRPAPVIRAPQNEAYVVIGYEGARSPMTEVSRNGSIVQYEGPGGVKMTLNNGFLARLRGLGQEHESFYIAQESAYTQDIRAVARSKAPLTRTMEYWLGQQPKRDRFRCVVSPGLVKSGLRKFSERCTSIYEPLSFENHYWFNGNGDLVKSRQWFHPSASALDIEHIVKR